MADKSKNENDLPGVQDQGGKHGGQQGGAGPTPQPEDQIWDDNKKRPERPDHVKRSSGRAA